MMRRMAKGPPEPAPPPSRTPVLFDLHPPRRSPGLDGLGMPFAFKLWFGFVALMALAAAAVAVWAAVQVGKAGPEGIGRAIGAAVRGFNEGAGR